MATFKPGDRVRVIEGGSGTVLGQTGTVVEDYPRSAGPEFVRVRIDGGATLTVYRRRFELAEPPHPFKVGDRVRVTFEGTLNEHGQLVLSDGSRLGAAWIHVGKVEILERPKPPYEAQKGDVVRLHFSDGAGVYVFDGDRFRVVVPEGAVSASNSHTRSRVEQMVHRGPGRPGDNYRYGGELLARDGKPV